MSEERELIAEWWEIWLNRGKPFAKRVMPEADEISKNLLIPAYGFDSKALTKMPFIRNYSPSIQLVHVRRTKKRKA